MDITKSKWKFTGISLTLILITLIFVAGCSSANFNSGDKGKVSNLMEQCGFDVENIKHDDTASQSYMYVKSSDRNFLAGMLGVDLLSLLYPEDDSYHIYFTSDSEYGGDFRIYWADEVLTYVSPSKTFVEYGYYSPYGSSYSLDDFPDEFSQEDLASINSDWLEMANEDKDKALEGTRYAIQNGISYVSLNDLNRILK